jgi:ABC-type transport system involved in cytochrome bd biosynthesis fused ATPase/permease subunit
LIAAMYSKISKLSMKSLTQTNSGKLITIVSGEIQSVERMLGLLGTLFASPFINAVAYTVLGITNGWQAAVITLGVWLIIMVT